MGTMALRAETVLQGFMPAFGCLKRLLRFLMALQTEGALVLEDHPVVVACVRVVAPQAQSFRERRMDGIVCDLFHEITVTLGAEFCPCRLEQFYIVRSVGIVTGETLAVLNGLVDGPFLKIGLRIGMAGVA